VHARRRQAGAGARGGRAHTRFHCPAARAQAMNAAFALSGLARVDHRRAAARGLGRTPGARALRAHSRDPSFPPAAHVGPAHTRSYCMDAAAMQLQRHGCGIHVVRARRGAVAPGGRGFCAWCGGAPDDPAGVTPERREHGGRIAQPGWPGKPGKPGKPDRATGAGVRPGGGCIGRAGGGCGGQVGGWGKGAYRVRKCMGAGISACLVIPLDRRGGRAYSYWGIQSG
jgi:hypothetical protein